MRIEVNEEFNALDSLAPAAAALFEPGGTSGVSDFFNSGRTIVASKKIVSGVFQGRAFTSEKIALEVISRGRGEEADPRHSAKLTMGRGGEIGLDGSDRHANRVLHDALQ